MSAHTPAHPAPMPASEDLLEVLFNVSMTGVILFRPVFAADGAEIVDLAYVRLNTAAQQMLQLPERPEQSFLTLYPTARPTGVFDFYCQAFQAATVKRHQFNYQHDGLDAYFYLAAQRSGEVLVVSFTDTNDQPRSAVEEALRASQVREQAARAAAEARQATLYAMFEQAPVAISLLQGPTHVIEFANARMAQLWDRSLAQVAGQAHFTALPELAGQGFEDILSAVWRTGEAYYLQEQLVSLRRAGQPYQGYFSITYQPSYDGQGQRTGVLTSAIDVTEQVLARQQVEQLNQQLEAARAEAERERNQLQALIAQAPVAIALFEGEDLHVTSVNAVISALWVHTPAQVLGRPLLEGVPELQGQGFDDLLRQVLHTQVPYTGTEIPATLRRGGQLHTTYFNFVYQPLYEAEGQVTGVLCVAVDVTEQVLARQQVQTLNEELAAINEELRASNEEFLTSNVELTLAQQQLGQLNQELEGRVAERTQEAETARASAERQRRQLEDLFMRAPSAICIFDGPDWVYQFVNPGYQQMFPGRQLLGRPLFEALPEVAGTPLVDILRAVYDTGVPFEGKEVLVPIARAEGAPIEDIYFDLTYQARYDEHGRIDGFVTYANDVTQQVLARRERAAQDQRLGEVFEQAPVAIAVFRGPDYVLDVVNPSMGHMWNRAPKEIIGRPFFTVLPELELQGIRKLLDEVRAQDRAYEASEQAVQLAHHQPGEVGYFSYVYQPLRAAPGQPAAIACVAIEVTAQVLARQQVQTLNEELAAINEELLASNEELNDSNHQLTRTNVDLDNFIYTASHDLKQPIANIEGLLLALTYQLPAEAQQDELVTPILERMQGAVDRFKRTIADLTEVSKLQQAHAQPVQTVNLTQLVAEVQLDLAPVLLEAQGQLVVDVAGCPAVTFSEKNLRSVIYNLLSNALKYRAPERPLRVQLTCAQVGQRVQLRVQDNGLGLDERQQSRLFGLFQRLHTHVEGTGIGLYMVKKMVENAGGSITVHSQLGVGSTFTVSLPI